MKRTTGEYVGTPRKKLALWRRRLTAMDAEGREAEPIGFGATLTRAEVIRLLTALEEEVTFGCGSAEERRERDRAAKAAATDRVPGCQPRRLIDGRIVWDVEVKCRGERYRRRFATLEEAVTWRAAIRARHGLTDGKAAA